MKTYALIFLFIVVSLQIHAATVVWDQIQVVDAGGGVTVVAEGPRYDATTGNYEWGDLPENIYGSVGLTVSGRTITTSTYFWYETAPAKWIVATCGDIIMDSTIGHLGDDAYLQKTPMDFLPGGVSGSLSVYPTKSVELQSLDEDKRFYLAFAMQDELGVDPTWYYGWVQLEIAGSSLSLVHSAIDIDGDPIRVGYMPGAIPEPSTGMLFLLGAAALGLRRRGRRVLSNRSGRFKPI